MFTSKKICYRSFIFMQFGQHILNIYGQFYVEIVSWQRSQRIKIVIQILTKYKIYTLQNF